MRIFDKFDKAVQMLNKVFVFIACVFLILIVFACLMQILTRYIPGFAFVGTEELARYAFIWTTFLGISAGVGMGTHPAITAIKHFCPPNAQKMFEAFVALAIIVMAYFLVVYGIKVTEQMSMQTSVSFRLNMAYVYLAPVVGGLGIALNAINNLIIVFVPIKEQEV